MSQKLYLITHSRTENFGYMGNNTYEYHPSHFKIGVAEDPEQRMKNMQVGTPHKLELVTTIESSDAKGVESNLHTLYRWLHKRGEWYQHDWGVRKSLVALDRLEPESVELIHQARMRGEWELKRSFYVMVHRAREGSI